MLKGVGLFFIAILVLSSNALANNCLPEDDDICGPSSSYIDCIVDNIRVSFDCKTYGLLVLTYPECKIHDNEFDTLNCIEAIRRG